MTKLIAALALLAALSAQAQTLTLTPQSCSGTCYCGGVQTDDPATPVLDYLNYSASYKRLTLSIDGVTYDSGVGGAQNLSAVQLFDGLGDLMTASVAFLQTAKLNRSGHNYYIHHCQLVSGSLVR
jgi:hypothetical protein